MEREKLRCLVTALAKILKKPRLSTAQNIADAIGKYRKKNLKTHEILDGLFVRTLHKALASDVLTDSIH